jgi:hypothetical protein
MTQNLTLTPWQRFKLADSRHEVAKRAPRPLTEAAARELAEADAALTTAIEAVCE